MSIEEYNNARRLAQKAARSAMSNGRYPYLPALDEFISREDISGEVPLGIVDIPLNKIAGTKTSGRKNSFANNFMPLLDEGTEFATKWSNLYVSQLEEGIRDPIIAYEYMTRYYVQEGNKRVSVMKFVGASSITAKVTRLLPKKTDDYENRVYHEYMDFYEVSKINLIDFTKEGSYSELAEYYDCNLKTPWTDDQRLQLRSDFSRFEDLFIEKGGDKLSVSAGDAFLVYLKVYNRKDLPFCSNAEIRSRIDRIWSEFRTQAHNKTVKLMLEPTEKQSGTNLLAHLPFLGNSQKRLKVAFIYGKSPATSAWTYSHELGRLYLEEVYGDDIETTAYSHAEYQFSPTDILEQAIQDKNNIIFTTTPYLGTASIKAAIAHPEVKVLNCATNSNYSSIRTYYCRMYETKFLLGVIAGALSPVDKIGYIAEYTIHRTLSNINAFALGAKMVNPNAKIELTWNSLASDVPPADRLDASIRFFSDKDFIVPERPDRRFGLYERDENGSLTSIATTVCNWGKFYEQIIEGIKNDTWKSDSTSNKYRAINYWWGMSAGVTELICSKKLPLETKRLVDLLTENIIRDRFHPFDSELIDNKGNVHQPLGKHLRHFEIMTMDWLAENVIGDIPAFTELKDDALDLVMLQGDLKPEK